MMKRSVKVALWSALGFPGVGHLMLRYYARGLVLVAVFAGLVWYLVHDMLARGLVEKSDAMVYKILDGEVQGDIGTMLHMLDLGPDPVAVQIATWAALACWILAAADAYRQIGRAHV